MKGKELKNKEKSIELLDGNHNITIDFNAFEHLENTYGDMPTAFSKFSGTVKVADIKNFLCASVNACIEDYSKHYSPFEIGKLLDLSKIDEYVTVLSEMLDNAMPSSELKDEDEEEFEEKN
jgi:hypothetical protein